MNKQLIGEKNKQESCPEENTITICVSNKAKCRKCEDIIESKHVHDFVTCKCGAISVDGGLDYLRRIGEHEDFEDLSESRTVVLDG